MKKGTLVLIRSNRGISESRMHHRTYARERVLIRSNRGISERPAPLAPGREGDRLRQVLIRSNRGISESADQFFRKACPQGYVLIRSNRGISERLSKTSQP